MAKDFGGHRTFNPMNTLEADAGLAFIYLNAKHSTLRRRTAYRLVGGPITLFRCRFTYRGIFGNHNVHDITLPTRKKHEKKKVA